MTIRTVLLAGIATIAFCTSALAADGLYLGGGLGYQSPMTGTFRAPALGQLGKYSLKSTNTFLLDTGWKFSNGIRLEIEGQYGRFDGDHLKITVPSVVASQLDGHITQGTVYLNADYDFPAIMGWIATVGGGVGSNWTDTKGSALGGLAILHGSDHAFAWQVGGGIIRRILPMVDLQVDYRYQGSSSTTVHEVAVGDVNLGDVKSQTVTLNLRWYLNPL